MSGLFGNNIFTIAQKSLDFRTSRHDLLASNVANKDTPGYQAEELGPLKQSDSRHFDGRNTPPLNEVEAQRILSASPYPDFDGNTVDLDREMAKIAENQLMYNATLRMLAHKFRGLKSAIAEGRS